MSDRDRLINLKRQAVNYAQEKADERGGLVCIDDEVDYLLANGVIALPCLKETVLYRKGEKCIANHWNIVLTAFNEENSVRLFDIKEVEQTLKEREGE